MEPSKSTQKLETSKARFMTPRTAVAGVLAGLVALTLGGSNVLAEYTYLAEPTQEFKDEQKRFANFKQEQLKVRKDWDVLITTLKGSEGKPEVTAVTLKEMNNFLKRIEGIPTGVKKTDIVKLCRGLKFAGGGKKISLLKIKDSWNVQCEIEYEALIQEYNKEVLPNNKVANTVF